MARQRGAWGVIALASILVPLNSTMIVVALVDIAADLEVGTSTASWIVTCYLVAMAAGQPVGGRIGDRVGHRRAMVSGLIGFAAVSVVASAAPTLAALAASRAAQAIAGALILPNALALLREHGGDRLGRRAGGLAAAMTFAAAAGPPLGAMVLATAGWRGIFLVNLPLVMATLVAGRSHLPVTARRMQVRRRAPLVLAALLDRRQFFAAATAIAAGNFVLYVLLIATPVLAARRDWTPTSAALLLSTLSVASFVAAPAGGLVADVLGRRRAAVIGGGLLAGALLWLMPGPGTIAPISLGSALLVAGIGLGLATPALQVAALQAAPAANAGAAAGLANTARYAGSISGTVMLARVLAANDGGVQGLTLAFTVGFVVAVCALFATLALPAVAGCRCKGLEPMTRRPPSTRAPGRALPTSVPGPPAVSRRMLVIKGGFAVPRSWWAKR